MTNKDYSIVYDRKPVDMLGMIDKRVLDLFGLYEYKPTPKSRESHLGTTDVDLMNMMQYYNYRIHAKGYDRKNDIGFEEFKIYEWNYWKIRKIIFAIMRQFEDYFEEALGEDWKDWAFIVKPRE